MNVKKIAKILIRTVFIGFIIFSILIFFKPTKGILREINNYYFCRSKNGENAFGNYKACNANFQCQKLIDPTKCLTQRQCEWKFCPEFGSRCGSKGSLNGC